MTQSKADSSEYITSLLSHDISNFNQTSRGYLEMLLADQIGELTDEQARVITICLRQTNRIQNLITAVRMLVELTNTKIQMVTLDMDRAMEAAMEIVERDFNDREIRVDFSGADRKALAEDHLECLFRHLLSNAVQHNDSDVVDITVEITAVEDPPRWRILFTDNGDGISAVRGKSLFLRLDTEDMHGSGVGLCLAKRLLDRWDCEIWLESSTPGQGSVFGVTLPRA